MNRAELDSGTTEQAPSARRWTRLPPAGTAALLVLHLGAFIALRVIGGGRASLDTLFVLHGAASNPAAIVLHAVGASSYLVAVLVLLAILLLGGPIERRFGTARLLVSYLLATLVSGAFYFAFAQAASQLSIFPLSVPAGALAAWVVAARRGLREDTLRISCRSFSVSYCATLSAAVVAGIVFFFQGERSTAWLLAACAGGLVWFVIGPRRGVEPTPTNP